MSLTAFVFAVLALLLAPGPTNTLVGVAGAQGGVGRVGRLLPAELAGYLATILPLLFVGGRLIEQLPDAAAILKFAAAAWVMMLSVRLWRAGRGGDAGDPVSAWRVFVTTMLNPKALIFGLVLLPPPRDPSFAIRLTLFCAMVGGVALLWGTAGAMTRVGQGGAGRLRLTQRVASVWLAPYR